MAKKYSICDPTSQTLNSDCFTIKHGDTCPRFKIEIYDPKTTQSISFLDWAVETYMYFKSFIGLDIDSSMIGTIEISLYKDINFCQLKVGDVIQFEDCDQSLVEYMFVESIDSIAMTAQVTRGYLGSQEFDHFKKDAIKIFRIFGKSGYIDSIYEDNPDTVDVDERDFSIIAYQWDTEDTSHTGDYFLFFKVSDGDLVRTFPLDFDGYCIQII